MYEFYVNEEWLGVARIPLDTMHEGYAVLKKYRIDADDEHVVVRRKADDDALRAELATRDAEIARLRELVRAAFFEALGPGADPNAWVDSEAFAALEGKSMKCTHCGDEIEGEIYYAYGDETLPVCRFCIDQYESICPVCSEAYDLTGPYEPEMCEDCAALEAKP